MIQRQIENFINEELPINDQIIALDFIEYLRKNEMEFIKDNNYWKDKIYYIVKFNNICVCFIAINDPDEKENIWTVWSDDMDSNCFGKFLIEKELKQIAWKHTDLCDNCGSCSGGRQKTIFGKDFDNICGCTFRFDNPNAVDLLFMKKMVEIRKKDIIENY